MQALFLRRLIAVTTASENASDTPNPNQPHTPAAEAGQPPPRAFNAGATIIGHVANSSLDHPLIHLPPIFGIDMSVTKHVLMLWVAAAISAGRDDRRRAPLRPQRHMVPSGPVMGLSSTSPCASATRSSRRTSAASG